MLETILAFISQPAVWGFLTTGIVSLIGLIAKKNVKTYRWDRITSILYQVVKELNAKGHGMGWGNLAVDAMRTLVEIIHNDPSIKNLTPQEIELLKPLVLSYAKAASGNVDQPMFSSNK